MQKESEISECNGGAVGTTTTRRDKGGGKGIDSHPKCAALLQLFSNVVAAIRSCMMLHRATAALLRQRQSTDDVSVDVTVLHLATHVDRHGDVRTS